MSNDEHPVDQDLAHILARLSRGGWLTSLSCKLGYKRSSPDGRAVNLVGGAHPPGALTRLSRWRGECEPKE